MWYMQHICARKALNPTHQRIMRCAKGSNCYLTCTMILRVNLLTTATMWDEYRECKIIPQLYKFNNIWPLNITPEQKDTQYLSSCNHKLSSYKRSVTWESTITNITRTYQINYDVISSQITTVMRVSSMCTRKWYTHTYIPVNMTYVCGCYLLSTYW